VIREAIAAGAMAYIPKSLNRATMAEALRRVLAGETWRPEVPGNDAGQEGAPMAERIAALTPQQRAILSLMAAGKPNKIIAYELGIAETTVKAHITLILRKLGVFSRTQAVLAARDLVS
jgi:DNA-binding NarL/FixJ family response regulator